jgi:hypothetical protein
MAPRVCTYCSARPGKLLGGQVRQPEVHRPSWTWPAGRARARLVSIWWTGSSPSPRPPVHSATGARATATTGRRRPKFGAAPGIGWLYLLRCREDPRSIPNARPHTKRGALDAELGALSMPNPRLAWRSRCRTGCARARHVPISPCACLALRLRSIHVVLHATLATDHGRPLCARCVPGGLTCVSWQR